MQGERGWCLILARVVRIRREVAHNDLQGEALDTARVQSGTSSGQSYMRVHEKPQTSAPPSIIFSKVSQKEASREQDWIVSR